MGITIQPLRHQDTKRKHINFTPIHGFVYQRSVEDSEQRWCLCALVARYLSNYHKFNKTKYPCQFRFPPHSAEPKLLHLFIGAVGILSSSDSFLKECMFSDLLPTITWFLEVAPGLEHTYFHIAFFWSLSYTKNESLTYRKIRCPAHPSPGGLTEG